MYGIQVKSELADLPSLGPTSAALLVEVGMENYSALVEQGAIGSYKALRMRFGKRIAINWIYALECASLGIHWKMLSSKRKEELKAAAQATTVELEGNCS